MQLLHEHNALMSTMKDLNMSVSTDIRETSTKDVSADNIEVKEKRSSHASLLHMNPVASGDNVATDFNSAHKIKDELPPLVPCCEGRELQINEDLVRSGLSAISVRHDSVLQCVSMSRAYEKLQVPPGFVKHRNSFRSLHRPDLKRVPYLRRMTPDELESLFRGYADLPSREYTKNDNNKNETTKVILTKDENIPVRDLKEKEAICQDEGTATGTLRPIPETRSCAEDVPAGMRLHGARARLYTSVLAGAKAGDQLESSVINEDYDICVPVDPVPEDEIQLNEELQIILPPRCDDVTADSSVTTATTVNSTES